MRSFLLQRLMLVSSLVVLAALSGCASDGGVGDKGVVRFSQIFNFVETNDFTPPVVVERTILIRLEHADLSPGRHEGYPELTLEVTGGNNQLLPLGFGEYAVRLDEEKSYRFHARDGARELDAITVKARKAASLRFTDKATVVTTSADHKCVTSQSVSLSSLVLHRNQSVTVVAVPADTDGSAMLGMLQLTAHETSGTLALDTPLFAEGTAPNAVSFEVKPLEFLGASLTVSAAEANGLKVDLPLPTQDSDAAVSCP